MAAGGLYRIEDATVPRRAVVALTEELDEADGQPPQTPIMKRLTAKQMLVLVLLLLLGLALVAGGILSMTRSDASPVSLGIGISLALLAVLFLLRIDVALLLRALQVLNPVLPLFAYLAVSELMGPTSGTLSFAEVGAQVIVVLLLVLAVDARFFRLRPDRDRLEVGAILLTMALLASGEYYALLALLRGYPAHSEVIAGAIAAGFVAVAVTAIVGSARSSNEEPEGDG